MFAEVREGDQLDFLYFRRLGFDLKHWNPHYDPQFEFHLPQFVPRNWELQKQRYGFNE